MKDNEIQKGRLATGEDLAHYYHCTANFHKSAKDMTLSTDVICYTSETAFLVFHDELMAMGVEDKHITMVHITQGEPDYESEAL